ncbi:MAG: DUF1330 domain-containing protein [Anaerolinea sp.]|nr:DUF1330 domain-containing protein [Anaerolinea sp.]
MTAYVLLDVHVHDPLTYAQYKELAPPVVTAYGGKYLARGGSCEILEGEWTPGRLVILEFPSVEQAKAWLDSPEYALAKELRHSASTANMVVVEGV